MYTPPFNSVHDETRARAMVAAVRTGWLVTVDQDGVPVATLLPLMWSGDRVIAHMARANPQWRRLEPGAPCLIIVTGPQAYVSPSWYAAKAEDGKVVPTWNYGAVHLTGTVTVHEDGAWLRDAVTGLTDLHEAGREDPWQVSDAPEPYLEGQLRGIVGIDVAVTRVEAKAKLSQNRSAADRRGVVAGLRADVSSGHLRGVAASHAHEMADEMAGELAEPAIAGLWHRDRMTEGAEAGRPRRSATGDGRAEDF